MHLPWPFVKSVVIWEKAKANTSLCYTSVRGCGIAAIMLSPTNDMFFIKILIKIRPFATAGTILIYTLLHNDVRSY